jgi:hypothetical protein
MRKITCFIALLFITVQISFSQDNHSKIRINNPNQSTLNTLVDQGFDLRCGVKHAENSLTLEVSNSEKQVLQQLGVSFSVEVENLEAFYGERATNNLLQAKQSIQLEKLQASTPTPNNSLQGRSSVSSTIIDNYLQYTELNEKDWTVPSEFNLGIMGGCLTVDAMESELDDMRSYSQSNGLNIVSVKQDASTTGRKTWGNPATTIANPQYDAADSAQGPQTYTGQGNTRWDPQTMYYVRITGNESSSTEGSKPQMLFTSMIHAREVSALMNNIYFMWYIIENYNTDAAIKNLVDNNELYFIPVVNPDGLRWNEHLDTVADGTVDDGGFFQRKNLRPNTGGTTNTTTTRGVDINRNFDYFWGTAGSGSSGTPSNDSYRGPAPESEPETKIIKEFVQSRNFKTAIWNHSFANSIPHPYGGNPSFVSGREDEMHEMHSDMTKYNRYVSGATIFSPSNGIADDWMLGGAADANGSVGSGENVLATTPEHGSTGFWPDPNDIVPIAKRSVRISLMGAYYGGKYAKFHDLTQSDISSLTSNLTFGIERVGQTSSDFTLVVTPISANITTINSPATLAGMTILEQRDVTAALTLDPSIQPNDKIEYKVQLSNDDGVFYEVNIEKYYQPTILFSHNPDSDGLTGWTNSGWSNTTADAYSGSNALRTGNAVPYANNTTKTLTTSSTYDLSNSTEVLIQFYSKWDIERNFDLVEFQASTNGSTWTTLNGIYTKPKSSSNTNDHALKGATDEGFQGNNSSGHVYDGDQFDNWVMEEIVISATNNATVFNNPNVSFRFRMRSDSENEFESYSANAEGFFIDDFKVIGIQIPCAISVPTGLASSNVSTYTADISWDNIPSATYDVRYRETGTTTWTDVLGLTTFNYSITGLDPLTEYEAQVRTVCTSTTSSYTSSVVFTTIDIITCTGTLITSFPYTETFDSGLGDWTQDTGDSGDWLENSGATGSAGTGPSDDVTGGSNYLFLEASSNGTPGEVGANATVILTSPCYDLTSLNSANFSFYHHMFGDNLGTINLEITSDDGTNWTNIFTRTGGSEDAWRLENINLSDYLGDVVKFRFTGITGGGFSSDIAIDQISLSQSPAGCISTATDIAELLSIRDVTFNTIANTNTTADVYSDFTSISTTVSKNTSYNISITPRYNAATTNAVGYAVWIDYNGNGDFTDSGEDVFSVAPVAGGNAVSGSITIPSNITTASVRMRVSMKFNGTPTSCETFQYGEVEDYTVNLFNGLLYSGSAWTPSTPNGTTGSEDIMILDGIYNLNSNVNVNTVTVASGAEISVDKANAITVNGNIINNGEFVMNSDSDEFSSLLLEGTASGNLKYNRHVNSNTNRNDLIAAPFTGESFTSFLGNNNNVYANPTETAYLFGPFDKTASDYLTYSSTETTALDPGKGYRAASTDNNTFTFTGAVTTAALNVPISKTGTVFELWNLIGNPYPSYIKLEDFLNANIGEFDSESAAVYGYDADNIDGSYWQIWNLAYAALNPNTLIAPGQGFFVSSKDGGGNISFTPLMRSSGASDDFIAGRTTNTIEHGTLTMSSNTLNFSTDLYFTDNASLGLDLGYDASHFNGAPSSFSIYSELVEENTGRDMAIQAINFNDINNNPIIPLGVNVNQGEQVTIALTNSNLNYNIYLEDVLTNTFTLLNTTDYTFTPTTDISDTGRFYLRFDSNVLSVDDSGLDKIQIYSDTNLKQIVVKGQLNSATELTLFDTQGREILKSSLNTSSTTNTINTSNFMSGVYLVQLSNTTFSLTKKLIIR